MYTKHIHIPIHTYALRTPNKRVFSGVPTEEFSGMIFEKNRPWGSVLKFCQCPRQLLLEVRCGAGMCDDPCILGRILHSAFMQARVRLGCMNETNMHGSSHVPVPRLISTSSCQGHWRNLSTDSHEIFFSNFIWLNSSFGTPEWTFS